MLMHTGVYVQDGVFVCVCKDVSTGLLVLRHFCTLNLMHSVWRGSWISNWPLAPPTVHAAQCGAPGPHLDSCHPHLDNLKTGKAFLCTTPWTVGAAKYSTSRSALNFSCCFIRYSKWQHLHFNISAIQKKKEKKETRLQLSQTVLGTATSVFFNQVPVICC